MKKELFENKIRGMVRQIMNEGPNADAQTRLVKSMKSLCQSFLDGKTAGLPFIQKMENELKDFKRTTGSK